MRQIYKKIPEKTLWIDPGGYIGSAENYSCRFEPEYGNKKMRIFLATCGSRGDVQPMIALCLALKSSGHDVMLAGPPEKKAWADTLGCPYTPLGKDVTQFLHNLEDAVSLKTGIKFITFVYREIINQFKILPELIGKADLVIASSLVFALSSLAEAKSIPYRYIAFTPQVYPSVHHPFPGIWFQHLPTWCNKLSWDLLTTGDRFSLTPLINHHRRKIGLAPVKTAWAHILGKNTVIAADEQIAEIPSDIQKKTTQTGYMHLELPAKIIPGLESFINRGTAPVFAGFGSMPQRDQAKTIPLLVKAARRVNKPIIISKFRDEVSEFNGADDVFFIQQYPHLNLFSKMCVVIHHGGAGTTATCAACGTPQVIVPHILDQYYHGHRIYVSGMGAKPIWRSQLTLERLVAALNECLYNDTIQETAKARALLIDREKNRALAVSTLIREHPA